MNNNFEECLYMLEEEERNYVELENALKKHRDLERAYRILYTYRNIGYGGYEEYFDLAEYHEMKAKQAEKDMEKSYEYMKHMERMLKELDKKEENGPEIPFEQELNGPS